MSAALALVLEQVDFVAEVVGGLVVALVQLDVGVVCVSEFVLSLAQFDGGVVELVFEVVLARVVVVKFLVHSVLQLHLAAVVFLQSVLK